MKPEVVHGVCIVRAAADGTGVHFTVLTTPDAGRTPAYAREESRHLEDVVSRVRTFVEEFAVRHDK